MERRCIGCKSTFHENEPAYYCRTCIAQSEAMRAEQEAETIKVACPDCKAAVGETCVTGSGGNRWPHVTREKLAAKTKKMEAADQAPVFVEESA